MVSSEDIEKRFGIFSGGTGGIDSWIALDQDPKIIESLKDIENTPLTQARLNQLLTLAHEAPISEAMFRYYWLNAPPQHPYDVSSVPDYRVEWEGTKGISSLDQLYWGMYRFYVDALLFFGSIRTAYQTLRVLGSDDLLRRDYFANRVFDSLNAATSQAEHALAHMAANKEALKSLTNWPWISVTLNAK